MQAIAAHNEAPRVRLPVREPHRHAVLVLLKAHELVSKDHRDAARLRLLDEHAEQDGAADSVHGVPRELLVGHRAPHELALVFSERGVLHDLGHFVLRDLVDEARDEAQDLQPVRLQAVCEAEE